MITSAKSFNFKANLFKPDDKHDPATSPARLFMVRSVTLIYEDEPVGPLFVLNLIDMAS